MNPEAPLLFVDMDDTLILYLDVDGKLDETGPHPYGSGAESYKINKELLTAVKKWKERVGGPVVAWSGGGQKYAVEKAIEAKLPFEIATSKDPSIPTPRDFVVDDDADFFTSAAPDVRVWSWREFVKEFKR